MKFRNSQIFTTVVALTLMTIVGIGAVWTWAQHHNQYVMIADANYTTDLQPVLANAVNAYDRKLVDLFEADRYCVTAKSKAIISIVPAAEVIFQGDDAYVGGKRYRMATSREVLSGAAGNPNAQLHQNIAAAGTIFGKGTLGGRTGLRDTSSSRPKRVMARFCESHSSARAIRGWQRTLRSR